jgi:hypothetical protein
MSYVGAIGICTASVNEQNNQLSLWTNNCIWFEYPNRSV